MKTTKHSWIPYYYEILYAKDGKNVNYVLRSVYCHCCNKLEQVRPTVG